MRYGTLIVLALLMAAGCAGNYKLSVPDQLAQAGGESITVVRLQRDAVAGILTPEGDVPIRFRVNEGPLRAAFTDNLGFGGTTVPVPAEPGVYTLAVALQDKNGVEDAAEAPTFVWRADDAVVAVDVSALPKDKQAADAAKALCKLAENAHVIYLTNRPIDQSNQIHAMLQTTGYPQGPVLLWRQAAWHYVQKPYPHVVVESNQVRSLPNLRKLFPKLGAGITDDEDGVREFAAAGMATVMIGHVKVNVPNHASYGTWAQYAAAAAPLPSPTTAPTTQEIGPTTEAATQPAATLPLGPATEPATQAVGPATEPATQPASSPAPPTPLVPTSAASQPVGEPTP